MLADLKFLWFENFTAFLSIACLYSYQNVGNRIDMQHSLKLRPGGLIQEMIQVYD